MKYKILIVGIILASLVSCTHTPEKVQEVSAQDVYNAVYKKSNQGLQVLDVRTPEEYGVSHLKDAQNICVTENDFKEKVEGLDKEKPVYVYCKKGGRSARAAKILVEMGFKEVYDLQGGITAWESEGLETSE
ncbi:rhodanese-like domain-containing protein [Rasiella rasia]|uniref:Rhodanese-like domain-containing protein n=1 Tax=Rasiella rasia TaxID=2744027 RepID=A0A6G6GKN7_9FLAO|nr:rhodanese-like domain-containing protein [Rasiella rasia]QIE59122.1 rhodanese-like domain-containing protein [Rasiella rasia]